MSLNKTYKNRVILILVLIMCGNIFAGFVLAQQKLAGKDKQPNTQSENTEQMNLAEQIGYFKKVSSTQIETDEGNKIVAVRQLKLITDDIDIKGNPIKREIPYVEIELFSKITPPATNSAHLVQIGAEEFHVGGKGCEEKFGCIIVVITSEAFERLKDNSLVTYRIGDPSNPETLKEVRKGVEPKIIIGAKFGRLNKKLIDKFPSVERNSVQQ